MAHRLAPFALALVGLALATPAAAGIDINVTGGIDAAGTYDLGITTTGADPGFTLGLEAMFEVPVVEAGVGLEYGFARGADIQHLDVSYTHLYGVARLFVFGRLYLVGRLGYYNLSVSHLSQGRLSSDFTLGGGVGLGILRNLKVELIFNNLAGDFDYETWSARAVYTF
jgi:hypothetical protein